MRRTPFMPFLNIFTSNKWSMPLFTRPFGVRIFISRTIRHELGTHLIATGNSKLMSYFYKLNHEHAICFPWVNIILITATKFAFKQNKFIGLMHSIRYSNASSHMHYVLLQIIFSIIHAISDSISYVDLHLGYISLNPHYNLILNAKMK